MCRVNYGLELFLDLSSFDTVLGLKRRFKKEFIFHHVCCLLNQRTIYFKDSHLTYINCGISWQASELVLLDLAVSGYKLQKGSRLLDVLYHTTLGQRSHLFHIPFMQMFMNSQQTVIFSSSAVP